MEDDVICLALGGGISLVISAAKRIPFVKRYPKWFALGLSVVVTGISTVTGDPNPGWVVLAKCVAEQFAAAVATHEAVVESVKDMNEGESA